MSCCCTNSYETIKKTVDEAITILEINRVDSMNKLNMVCMKELIQALLLAQAEDACRVVVITGVGEYFCGGGELGDFRTKSAVEINDFAQTLIELVCTIKKLTKPVIAAVQGSALGGGFSLVEACDLAFSIPEANFGIPEMKGGFCPAIALIGVIQRLR